MKKVMYYYNRKYPEYELEKVPVSDEEYLIRKGWKILNGIIANYDICNMRKCEEEHFITLYSTYDEEIYIHDNTFGNELVFSHNKERITQWRNEDIENTIHKLEERLNNLKENK